MSQLVTVEELREIVNRTAAETLTALRIVTPNANDPGVFEKLNQEAYEAGLRRLFMEGYRRGLEEKRRR